MTKVFVTGGAGFVGSHAAEHFARKGEDVAIYDNLSRSETIGKMEGDPAFNWNYLAKNFPRIKRFKADVRNFQDLREASRSSNVIVHTAAQVAMTSSLQDPRTDFEINTLGTFNSLEAARLNDSAFLFCSTNKVYGENVNKIPVSANSTRYSFADPSFHEGIPEDFPIDYAKHSPYGTSKLSADAYVQEYAHTYGLKTGVFRMSCIYGERQFGLEDQGWLSWFIIATIIGKPITIYGDGKQVRDVLYVKDLVDAFDRFILSGIKHGVFNIGGGHGNTLSLVELVEMLSRETGKKPVISYDNWRIADQKVYISNIGKSKEQLGWTPTVSPKEGVKLLINWVTDNISTFQNPVQLHA